MLVFWRGIGWAVPLIMFGWIFALVFVMIATQGPEADPNADATTARLFGFAFLLSAGTVSYLARRRARRPPQIIERSTVETVLVPEMVPVPGGDHFMFVPLKYWSYLFAVTAVWFFFKAFLGG